ncbi:piggyBac transposable element-derived protein 4-like [Mytilus edulis]|uniref:piggyBac transposable element-derived protein 4-like n=1 Tax=Mytilus edulis TaxID=6550 RepID=UPI0039F0FAFD
MSSDESDEFEGFSQGEIDEAEARYQHQLLQQGLGDDTDSDGFIESDDSDIEINDDIPGPAGDAGNVLQNGWHEQFIYHERGMPHLFTPSGISGPTRIMPQDQDPTDFLKLFLTDMLIENLINEADRYAVKQKEQHPNQNKMAWVKPTVPEMNAFLGLCFQMGVDRKPSTKMYWSTDHFLHTPVFPNTMSRDRFTQIMRYLHFSNSELEPLPGAENYDPLFKVKPLVNHFNACFNQEYNPKRNVTVDECMIPFKGRVQFRQYMPAKPHKWGVKVWMLAESQSSYIKFIDIYPGRRATPQLHLASNVVKRCLQGAQLEGKGYHVYTDNFFSSPELFEDLFQNYGTAACGTVRINRRGLPVDIICKRPEGINQRGDMKFRQKGCLVASAWKDKKVVNVLSTIHDNSTSEVQRLVNTEGTFSRQNFVCPKMVSDYTSNMGGVDRADQYIQYYCYNHKTIKWSKRVFFVLLEMAKLNAFKLFIMSHNHPSSMTFLDFTLDIAKGLVAGYSSDVRRGRPSQVPLENRLVQRHMPTRFDKKSKCHLCYMRTKNGIQETVRQTKFGCNDCRKHLCLPECFTKFHTVRNCYN